MNNDGWEDLFMVNSAVKNGGGANALLINNRDATFLDLSALSNAAPPNDDGRTALFANFNRDGFMDVFVANHFYAAGKRVSTLRLAAARISPSLVDRATLGPLVPTSIASTRAGAGFIGRLRSGR